MWRAGTKTRVALTPGHVSMETDDEVVAPSLVPASLTWATTWFAGEHLGGADERSQRIDQRQGVQSRLRQHHGAGLPGHRGQQQHRLPVHGAVHGEHVTATRLAGEPGLHADDPLQAEQRRVGRDRPGDRQRDGRHLHHGGEGGIGHVESRHLEQVRGGGLRPRIDAAGIGEVRVVHAEAGRGGVHLRHEGGNAPGVPGGQQVGEVVSRVHQHAADHLCFGDLLVQRHLRVGVVVDGGAVVVVDLGLRDRDGRSRLARAPAGGRATRRRPSSTWSGWPPAPPVSGPDATSMPMDGTAMAPCPVVGHGSVTVWAGTCTVRARAGVTAGAGSGARSRTPTKAPAATTRRRSASRKARRRPRRRRWCDGAEWRPCSGAGGRRRCRARAASRAGTAPP